MSDFSLVLPCLRCVGKYNFDVPFTNKTFVIQLINSNRQHTHPVYMYRLHVPYKSLKYIFGRYLQIPLNKLRGVSSQGTAGFTHTTVESAWINNDLNQCKAGLDRWSPLHFEWQSSERVSQTFRQSYFIHMISSYCLSWRILNSSVLTSLQRPTELRPHDFAQPAGLQLTFRPTKITCC